MTRGRYENPRQQREVSLGPNPRGKAPLDADLKQGGQLWPTRDPFPPNEHSSKEGDREEDMTDDKCPDTCFLSSDVQRRARHALPYKVCLPLATVWSLVLSRGLDTGRCQGTHLLSRR